MADRLLIVSDTLAGGLGALTRAHAAWFAAHGWNVAVAAPSDGKEPDAAVTYLPVPSVSSTRRVGEMAAARRALRGGGARAFATTDTVVHVHGMRSFLLARVAGLPRPFVSVHGTHAAGDDPAGYDVLRRAWFALLPRLSRGASTGEPGGPSGWTYYPFASPLLATLDVLAFPPASQPATFAWLGLLDDRKQPEVFVRALARLAADGLSVRGLLGGAGPRAAEIAALVAELGAPIEMLGAADPVAVLRDSIALCLFARSEGTPLAVTEAMWAGRSVVGSDVPGIRYLVGDTGALADNVDAATAAMRALATDHALAVHRGAAAAARVRTLLTPETPWPDLERAYRAVKILIAHARYIQPGGEEAVIDAQAAALTALGQEVVRFEPSNEGIDTGLASKVQGAAASVWSRSARRDIAAVIARERPDVLHVHNNFQTLSPSIYAAAQRANVPVVQHLHNARLACVNAFFERDGGACTDCVGKRVTWPGVVHRCYRDSVPGSVAATAVQLTHRGLGTHRRRVDLFLAVSQSLATSLVDAGVVPADNVVVCHNGLAPDPGARRPGADRGYALYAGRLSPEKGLCTLLEAAAAVPDLPLKIAGDGPLEAELHVEAAERGLHHVEFLGRVSRDRLLDELRGARVTVAPSVGADPLPTAIIEATAVGVPTIGSRIGGIPELVVDGITGALVAPGEATALADALRAAATDADGWRARGVAARTHFEQNFTAEAFGARLVAAYESVL